MEDRKRGASDVQTKNPFSRTALRQNDMCKPCKNRGRASGTFIIYIMGAKQEKIINQDFI